MQRREASELLGKLCCRNDSKVRGKSWVGPLEDSRVSELSDFWCGVEAFVGSSPRRKEVVVAPGRYGGGQLTGVVTMRRANGLTGSSNKVQ